ncbi:MAG TPA: ABC transporter permease, partial [Deltaproteobacteria bacterium]|nr:ABC transporter permease [Deltaproteobacteria bacterium]
MTPSYPQFSDLHINLRRGLHPLFQGLKDGISEFTFAN